MSQVATIIIALLPPLILVGILLIVPHLSSPVWPYQLAVLQDPGNRQLRWNLAVVATAHLYCGRVAQMEWLSQMIGLTADDRARALTYIKGVRSRLQQIRVLALRDVSLSVGAALFVFLITMVLMPERQNEYGQIESLLTAMILLLSMSLFMFYLLLQRWQHIRRLMELEEVFDELLPPHQSTVIASSEDEVERWYREQNARRAAADSKTPSIEFPPAPWE